MNEKHVEKLGTLIRYIEERRLSARDIRLTPVRKALERYEKGIRDSEEDVCDYYRRTGELPGNKKSPRASYTFDAVVSLIQGKTPEEVRREILQKLI